VTGLITSVAFCGLPVSYRREVWCDCLKVRETALYMPSELAHARFAHTAPLYSRPTLSNCSNRSRCTTSKRCFVMIVKSAVFTASSKVSLREVISSTSRPKVSAVRRAIATDPWSLFACFLHTDISANPTPSCDTGPKYSFNHTTMFFSRVVSASASNPLRVSFSD